MRKYTLFVSFFLFILPAFSQMLVQPVKWSQKPEESTASSVKSSKGTVIWSENFDQSYWISTVNEEVTGAFYANGSALPSGWSVYDGNGLGYVWHWSNVGPRGRYTSYNPLGDLYPDNEYIDGTFWMPDGNTLSNGFMMLESDYYNTDSTGNMAANLVLMDAYVQVGPIDLSSNPYVLLEFNQLFRYCCDNTDTLGVFVSNNYYPETPETATWKLYDTKGGTDANTFCLQKARHLAINISQVAGGSSNVYIRFYHKGNYATHYFWFIDDVQLTEPPVNDLIVTDSWYDYINTLVPDASWTNWDKKFLFYGGYTSIPRSATGNFLSFRAAVENFGSDPQTAGVSVSIDKDGINVYYQESGLQTLYNGDTVEFSVNQPFFPWEKGNYVINGNTVMQTADENPNDNSFNYPFQITDNLYSRVYDGHSPYFGVAGPTDWANGGSDGDAVAQKFDIPAIEGSVKLVGARVYFPSYRESGLTDELNAIAAGSYSMQAKLFSDDGTGWSPSTELASGNFYQVSLNDTSSWIELPFNDNGNLVVQQGTYWVAIFCYNGNVPGTIRNYFNIGTDLNGPKQPDGGGVVYLASLNGWYSTPDDYAIDMYVNYMPGALFNLTFNVDMSGVTGFNSSSDVLYVTGSFNGWPQPGLAGSILMTDNDMDNIYTATIQVDPSQPVEYKYFINAGWGGGEWPGDPNRRVQLTYEDLTTNDVFGNYPGVEVGPKNWGTTLYCGYTPVIDGYEESQYKASSTNNFDRLSLGSVASESDNSGYFRTLWDNNYLYYFARITDDDPVAFQDGGTSYLNDGIEFWVDYGNRHLIGPVNYDEQMAYRINLGASSPITELPDWITPYNDTTDINFATLNFGDYYTVEAAIPWTTIFRTRYNTNLESLNWYGLFVDAGYNLGFESQVFDATSFNQRKSILSWANNSGEDMDYQSSQYWGTLTLNYADAILSNLTVNGTTIDGFQPENTNYLVILPMGTTDVPPIGWELFDPWTSYTYQYPTNLYGKTQYERSFTLTIYGSITRTYIVEFYLISNDAVLSGIKINKVDLPGFYPEVTQYSYELPAGTVQLPDITYSKALSDEKVTVENAENLYGTEEERTASIKVVSADGKSSRTYTILLSISGLGLNNTTDYEVQVFPSPAGSFLNIQNVGDASFVRIYDLSGKLKMESEVTNPQLMTIDVSELSSNVYIVQILYDKKVTVQKFIKR